MYICIDMYVCVSVSFYVSSCGHACNIGNDADRASI